MKGKFTLVCLFAILVISTLILFLIYNSDLQTTIDMQSFKKIIINLDYINSFKKISKKYDLSIFKNSTLRKYAILSVSMIQDKDFYFFQLPMVVKAWERLGYKTIVLVVASKFPLENKLGAKTVEYLKKFDAIVINIETKQNYEVIVSLIARLFGSMVDDSIINDNDFIITSDTDLYPIDPNYYLNDEKLSKDESMFLWNAYCCGNFNFNNRSYTMYPMGHIGMKKKYWRSVMNLDNKKDVKLNSKFMLEYLKDFFKGNRQVKENDKIGRGDDNWYMDQVMIGVNIGNYKYDINKNIELVKIPHSCARLDRGGFNPGNYDMKQFCDFHSFHQDVYAKFDALIKVYQNLFNNQTNGLIQQYHKEFLEIKTNKTLN